MKTGRVLQFELLRLRWQSTGLLLFKPVFKTIAATPGLITHNSQVLAGLVAHKMMAGVAFAQNTWIGTSGLTGFPFKLVFQRHPMRKKLS
jgi:hypothetical protein